MCIDTYINYIYRHKYFPTEKSLGSKFDRVWSEQLNCVKQSQICGELLHRTNKKPTTAKGFAKSVSLVEAGTPKGRNGVGFIVPNVRDY